MRRHPDEELEDRRPGSELVGWRYEGPFDHLPAAAGVEHRVIPWDDVSMDEGTGIVHIAPGCGSEDFELSRVHDLAVLTPVDEAGRFYPDYGWLHGLGTAEAADQLLADLAERGRLIDAGTIEHRFPFCWRCHTPLIFRISDDWFIAVEELRPKLIDANATIEWTPEYFGKRMDDWLRNLGDWNISRRRFFGLPLPFYPCGECGHLTVVGSKGELSEKATGRAGPARGAPPPVGGRGDDPLRRLQRRGRAPRGRGGGRLARRRHRPVLDARLGEPGVASRTAMRPAPRRGSRPPTCPTTSTGRRGSRPTG